MFKAGQPGSRYAARVSFVDAQADLALLEVEDASFFASVRPLTLGETPPVQTAVQAYGFPVGGDTVSVTSGIISRIEIGNYAHSMEALMMAQIDAALNPGNSGGPVLGLDGTVVGIATMIGVGKQSEGYAVPVETIRRTFRSQLASAERAEEAEAPPKPGEPGDAGAGDHR